MGNVVLDPARVGPDQFSVVNVSQLYTVSKEDLQEPSGTVDVPTLDSALRGVMLVLGLGSP